jgi:hypothetical protein
MLLPRAPDPGSWKDVLCRETLRIVETGIEGLILHAMQGVDLLPKVISERPSLRVPGARRDESGLLLRRNAETSAPLELQKRIVRGIDTRRPHQGHVMR